MSRMPVVAAVLVVLLGAVACGQDDPKPKVEPTSSTTAQPTDGSTPTTSPSASGSPTSPAVGLPTGFPAQADVPLVSGVVTSKTGGKTTDGRVGWVIELSTVGSQQDCFDRAAAVLVKAGFTKQGEMTAQDTKQAQFTTTKWAVIISARADGDNCQLGYEVGQLSQ